MKVLSNIIKNIQNSILLIYYSFRDIFSSRKVPVSWSEGEKGVIVLIPGFAEKVSFIKLLGDRFNKNGYKVVYPNSLSRINNIEENVDKVISELNDLKIKSAIFITHKEGGLVAARVKEVRKDLIDKFIAINTPWNIADILGSRKRLIQSKDFIDFRNNKSLISGIINIYSKGNNTENTRLKGVKNILIDQKDL
ncbi:MAG: hypothetical protein Q9M91_02130 [Candidatus Dojkabacteria bacterium]|nr:hypothetical protein [Candidatus Dojkabacteria bacterium]